MGKLVVLKLDGDFEQGFRVRLEIGEPSDHASVEIVASLPPTPDVSARYESWQLSDRCLGSTVRIKPKVGQVTNVSITQLSENCHKAAQLLSQSIRVYRLPLYLIKLKSAVKLESYQIRSYNPLFLSNRRDVPVAPEHSRRVERLRSAGFSGLPKIGVRHPDLVSVTNEH